MASSGEQSYFDVLYFHQSIHICTMNRDERHVFRSFFFLLLYHVDQMYYEGHNV